MLDGLINGIFNGISIGAVLLIVALGLAIVFGLMGVINLAHGELMMLGAYTTYVVQNGFKLYFCRLAPLISRGGPSGIIARAQCDSVALRATVRNAAGHLGG